MTDAPLGPDPDPPEPRPLWHGRFVEGPSEALLDFTVSLDVDRRLAFDDLDGSRAHVMMLEGVALLRSDEARDILAALDEVRAELKDGRFVFAASDEDIHTAVERRVTELAGAAGAKLHTGRSRNDQVATDLRLYLRREGRAVALRTHRLQEALVARAAESGDDVYLPGYTHLQRAQPVLLAHHLLAHFWALARDVDRWRDALVRVDVSPLGAGALAGSSLPLEPALTSDALGFARRFENSLDAVSDRDFAIEFLAAAALAGVHLSRFAEEVVLWCSDGFGLIALSDTFTTGSSIMPQKRNPDAAELVRAKTGRLNGSLIALLTVMKGLPLAYGKDMQEDKIPVFEAADALELCLAATTGMVRDMRPDRERLRAAADRGFSTATDLADWLVRIAGVPFRRAHHVTGMIVKRAEAKGCTLAELPLAELQALEPAIGAAVYDVLDPDRSVASRVSFGGTAPESVRTAVGEARRRFLG